MFLSYADLDPGTSKLHAVNFEMSGGGIVAGRPGNLARRWRLWNLWNYVAKEFMARARHRSIC